MAEKTKQWYEDKPELLVAEKTTMEKLAKVEDKEFVFLKDGRACWYIKFESKLSGRKYNVALVEHKAINCTNVSQVCRKSITFSQL